MLYVNDELVKSGSKAYERYQDFKKKILPKLPNPVIFKSGRKIKINHTGLPEPIPSEWIPLEQESMGEDGGEHWRYCNRPPRKRSDGNFIYTPRGIVMKGRGWTFDKNRDTEQIFFFYELSSFVKNGRIIMEDKRKEARMILDKATTDLDVRWMITSSKSPISVEQTGSENTLRMMAAAWGVPNAHTDELSIEEIKVALLSAVQESHSKYLATKRGYDEFLDEVNEQNRVAIMANIQRAYDTKVIVYDQPSFSWRYASTNMPIMTVPARDAHDPKAALNYFLLKNDKSAKILELALDETYLTEEEEADGLDSLGIKKEDVMKMTIMQLRTAAKVLGIKTQNTMKQDEMRTLILEKLGYSA